MTISCVPLSVYDCFSMAPFGGSQAAIVEEGWRFSDADMTSIARELGLPVTVFLSSVSGPDVHARFFSTVMEQPMCGHGAIGLFTHLATTGQVAIEVARGFRLHMPNITADVHVQPAGSLPLVMLDVTRPEFEAHTIDLDVLCDLLATKTGVLATDLPVIVARADFVHLMLPFSNLGDVRALQPDFSGLERLCRTAGLETVCAFSLDTQSPDTDVHVRDFCPAVGVAESSSAGTTNAVLASYLCRQGALAKGQDRHVEIVAEQGIELGRASRVRSALILENGEILRVQVGGTAAKFSQGQLNFGGS